MITGEEKNRRLAENTAIRSAENEMKRTEERDNDPFLLA
jgi:hypothetical protein